MRPGTALFQVLFFLSGMFVREKASDRRFEYSTPYGLAVTFRVFDIRARSHGGLPRFEPPLDAEMEEHLMWMKSAYQPVYPSSRRG